MSGDNLIINVALTGNVPTKADSPFLPTSPDEIAADVVRCYEAGASVFHIHAREENGKPSYGLEPYREIITKIHARCQGDPILCVTTSGRVFNTFDKRSQVLDLDGDVRPAMASLTLGSMNFPKQASVNDPDLIRRLAEKMNERRMV